MNKKELLKEKIRDFQNSLPYKLIPREISLPVDSGKIVTVTGVRRCGKTHVLYDTINHLISGGIAKEQILFLSFDDERFNFKTEEFDLILRAYRELFPEIMLSEVYIFFDEIQMADHWEQFVRRIYDSETKRIFLSGSNSKMLASDIATSLRGRTLQFEIFPLSFSEYCDFNALDKDIHLTKNAAKLLNASKAFVKFGSFPELSLTDHSNYDNILQEYYFVLLYKDIVERYNIRNVPVLKYFVSRLLNNLSKPTSINKIYNEVRSAGLKTDKNLLYQLLDHLEAVYFSFRLSRFEQSVLKSELTLDKKVYFIDNGLVNSLTYSHQDDFGKLLENSIFLWLRSNIPFQRGLYYYKGKTECDFVVFDKDKPVKLIQACWDVSEPDTLKREVAGLIEAAKYFNCNDLTIITADNQLEISEKGLHIKIMPAWKTFISNMKP